MPCEGDPAGGALAWVFCQTAGCEGLHDLGLGPAGRRLLRHRLLPGHAEQDHLQPADTALLTPRRRPRLRAVPVAVRVIPCLDVHAGRVVKGVNFVDLRDAGDPVELGRRVRRRGGRRADLPRHLRLGRGPGDHAGGGPADRGDRVHPAHRGRRGRLGRRRRRAAAGRGGQGGDQHRGHPPAGGDRRDHPPVRQPGAGAVGRRAPGARSAVRLRGDHPRRADRGRTGRGRVGAARRRPRGGGDPAQLDGRRRDDRRASTWR